MSWFATVRLLVISGVVLVLTGCFDLEQKLVLDKDRFSYNALLRVDAKLAAVASARSQGDFCDQFIPLPAKIPQAIVLNKEQALEGGNQVCRFKLTGPTLAFEAVGTTGAKGAGQMTVERIDERTLKLTHVLRMNEKMPYEPRVLDALLAGRLVKWSVAAPRIVSSNGTISADGRQVDWAVPVAELFASPQTFEAVFEYDPPWFATLVRSALRLLDAVLDKAGLQRK